MADLWICAQSRSPSIVRFAVLITAALCALAGDVAVRREGPSFRITGAKQPAEVSVYVGEGDVPPVLGTVLTEGPDIVFHPRFEVSRTVASRVVVNGRTFSFPAEKQELNRTTFVERVYPTGEKIPANQLKFYVQFSAPMLPGDAWENLQLLDSKGKVIDLAFLEIDQELWDRDARRLTVLFDPGLIKRGVLPRDEEGAALEAGKSYTLVVRAKWRDAQRIPITQEYRKRFEVVAEDRTAIDPGRWKITAPATGSRDPLVISFGEPLDSSVALRMITVDLAGTAQLGPEEREWRYVPDQAWPAAKFDIVIDTALEDLAGNKVGRPFDVDTFERISVRTRRELVRLPVTPKR